MNKPAQLHYVHALSDIKKCKQKKKTCMIIHGRGGAETNTIVSRRKLPTWVDGLVGH
jgi:hypothetical protein